MPARGPRARTARSYAHIVILRARQDVGALEDRVRVSPRGRAGRRVGGPGGPCSPRAHVRDRHRRDGGRPRRPRDVPRRKGHEGGDHRGERPRRQRARAVPDDGRPRGRAPRAPRPEGKGRGPLGPGGGSDRRGRASKVSTRRCTSPARTSPGGAGPRRGRPSCGRAGAGPTRLLAETLAGLQEEAEGARLGLGHRLLRQPRRRVGDGEGRPRRRLPRPPVGRVGEGDRARREGGDPRGPSRAPASS